MRTLPDSYYEKEEKQKKPRKKAVKVKPPVGVWLPAPRKNKPPAHGNTLVDVRFGDGHITENSKASSWGWGYLDEDANDSGAIISYRIRGEV